MQWWWQQDDSVVPCATLIVLPGLTFAGERWTEVGRHTGVVSHSTCVCQLGTGPQADLHQVHILFLCVCVSVLVYQALLLSVLVNQTLLVLPFGLMWKLCCGVWSDSLLVSLCFCYCWIMQRHDNGATSVLQCFVFAKMVRFCWFSWQL